MVFYPVKNKAKNISSNQLGMVFPLSFLLLLLACLLTVVQIHQGFLTINKMKSRSRDYLCFKYLNLQTGKHIKFINSLNILIASLQVAKLTPIPGAAAAANTMIFSSQAAQQAHALSYMKNILKNKNCSSKTSAIYLLKYPYKGSPVWLRRNLVGLTILKAKKWKTVLPGLLSLTAKWKVNGPLSPEYIISTKEINFDHFRGLNVD